ncbi:thymidine kinase [Coprothermobacter platensis]|uniref:thymidine kinase n=1 Tax=Coprothermobacter platensis TaxID=108819 RepID=UPI0003787C46|nr:thymidine kinase [Coprothermobacter platensis]
MEIVTQDGWLEVITGCMFSGKTEELVRRLRRAVIARKKTVAIKPTIDTRYDLMAVVSHSGFSFNAIPIGDPKTILSISKDAEVVGIDESQFFTIDLIPVIQELLQEKKRVIVAGLDLDFRGEPFGIMPNLLALADEAMKLHAICSVCGNIATKTQRLIDGKPARYDDPTILVGGLESYEARCNLHHEVPGKTLTLFKE